MHSFIFNFRAIFYAILVIVCIETIIYVSVSPSKTFHSNLLGFSYLEKPNLQRLLVNNKLDSMLTTKAEIIQAGDSSGLYGVMPREVMKQLPGVAYVNESCCGDSGFAGYRYIAQRFLKENKQKKILVMHLTPYTMPLHYGKGFSDILKESLISPQHLLYDNLPSMARRLDVTNAIFYGQFSHALRNDPETMRSWNDMLPQTLGWVTYPRHTNKSEVPTGPCAFDHYLDEKHHSTFYPELVAMKKLADQFNVKLVLVFNPVACTDNPSVDILKNDLHRFSSQYPDVTIPFPLVTTWDARYFHDRWHLTKQGAMLHSREIGLVLSSLVRG